MSDPLDDLARAASESRHVTARRVQPQPPAVPPPMATPVIVVQPPAPPHYPPPRQGPFGWGFGVTLGVMCAIALVFVGIITVIILGCMGISLAGSAAAKKAATPPPAVTSASAVTATPTVDSAGVLQIQATNPTAMPKTIVVLVTPGRSQVPPVRMTFKNVPAGQTASAKLNSPSMQTDARAGVMPTVQVESSQ